MSIIGNVVMNTKETWSFIRLFFYCDRQWVKSFVQLQISTDLYSLFRIVTLWIITILNYSYVITYCATCHFYVRRLNHYKARGSPDSSVVDKTKKWLAVTRSHCYTILKLSSNVSQLISSSVSAIYLYKFCSSIENMVNVSHY